MTQQALELSKTLLDRFNEDQKNSLASMIVSTTAFVKYCKDMYVKHAFDSMGPLFKTLYDVELNLLSSLKQEYKEKYGR